MELIRVIFTLDRKQRDFLKARSERIGASMSWQVRGLINKEMEREEAKRNENQNCSI